MIRLIVTLIAVALIQVLTGIGLLLQAAPNIARLLWQVTLTLMALSCIGYRALFERIERHWPRLALTRQPWRMIASMCLSVIVLNGVWLAAGWVITLLVIAGTALHGLLVALAWDQLALPRGQSLGR